MATAAWTVVAILAALLAAMALVVGVEMFSSVVHPFPPGVDETMEEMCAHVARYPAWVLAVVVPLYGCIAFIATWIANRIGNRGAAIFVGVALLAGLVCNLSMLPYPIWFKVMSLIVIPAALAAGSFLASRRKTVGA